MCFTDPIADMLTRIRNAFRAGHQELEMPASKIKIAIAAILEDEGYIQQHKVNQTGLKRTLHITLKYGPDEKAVIRKIKRISKPGCRIYVGKDEIPRVLNGLGIVILSTPKGLMTGSKAKRAAVGGEVLCSVW